MPPCIGQRICKAERFPASHPIYAAERGAGFPPSRGRCGAGRGPIILLPVDAADLLRINLLSPMVLAFALGIGAGVLKSDLKLPEPVYAGLSIYLLLGIGLKGGAALSATPVATIFWPAVATLVLGLLTPCVAYATLRALRFSVVDAAAVAAHYGSVSAVTFIASLTFLQAIGVRYEGFLPTLTTLLEVPGIVVALLLARRKLGGSLGEALREILTGRSVLLLAGGLGIGFLSGEAGLKEVAPFFVEPFKGALTLFLLELGIVAAARLKDLRRVGGALIGFGIVVPIVHGALGVLLGTWAGLSLGGSTVLGVMAASASYIAAPAAVRLALPEANPTLYLTASLGVTFPFNLGLGIPLFYQLARWLHGG